MKITKVQAIPLAIPLKKSFAISFDKVVVKRHVLVRLQTDGDGIEGIGEVGVLPAEIGGPMESLVEAVNRYLAPAVTGCDPLDIADLHARMDRAVDGFNFAKAAVDIAAHDAAAKALGVPLHKLIGGAYRDGIPVTWVIGIDTTEENTREAVEYVRRGYTCLKIKVGSDPDGDVHRIREIRRAVGSDVKIRVDANQGYSPKVAIRTIKRMEEFNLQCVEQPVPKLNLEGLAEVAHAVDTPIMSDEAVYHMEDLLRIINLGAADIVNIKLARIGGLYRARQAAALAETAGLSCILGCMLEVGVGIAAGAHFAAATPNVTYESDLIGHLLHSRDIVNDSEKMLGIEKGVLPVPNGPGLGISLDEEAVRMFTVK